MDSSTIDIYNLQLQQQQLRQEQELQQYPQQHQTSFCNPIAATTATDMIWNDQHHFNSHHEKQQVVKTPYILSPPTNHDFAHRHHPYHNAPHNVYFDRSNPDRCNGFYHEEEHGLQMKREDSSSLFIDSVQRESIVTTNMYAREDNISQSSSNNTVPSSSSASVKRKGTRKQQANKNETSRKKSNTSSNTSTVVTNNKEGVIVEKRRYRRESHNAVERRRRNNINDNIKNLGQLLPDNMREGKLNKGSILKGSVVYIHMLNEQLSHYKEKLERLQYEAANISSIAAASSV